MKKGLIFLAITALFLGGPLIAQANTLYQNTGLVPKGETINDNFVRFAYEVVIDGNVEGDVIVAGNTITINGKVSGDVLAAGQTIKINGPVAGNVRVIGSTVDITNTVGKNVNIAAQTAILSNQASVGWSLSFASMNISVQAPVAGNIYGLGRSVTLNNSVGTDVTLHLGQSGQASLMQKTQIGGNFTYTGTKSAVIQKGAQITGNTVKKELPEEYTRSTKFLSSSWIYFRLISLFGLLLVGTLIISVFKNTTKKITEKMSKEPGHVILWGILYLIIVPIVIVLLSITIIGLPLALIITVLFAILLYVSTVITGTALGLWLLGYLRKKKDDQTKEPPLIWAMILGTIILFVITSIRMLGAFVSLLSIILFLGAVGAYIKEKNKPVTKQS
jgi:cytoskeletal protein CcmA (bactofilin family)